MSELREIHPVLCYAPKGDTVTFKAIENLIKKEANKYGVPVAFAHDEIISDNDGSIVIEDCLIVFHPEHIHDYIKIVFRIKRDGDKAFIIKNEYGTSPRMTSTDMFEEASKLRNSFMQIVENDKELEVEKRYYLAIHSIFKYVKC
jgi:hypothetical protein